MKPGELTAVFMQAVAAVDPVRLTESAIRQRPGLMASESVTVLALGKAAAAMTRGVDRALDGKVGGVAVTPEPADLPAAVVGFVGAHPHPDGRSVVAGRALLDAAAAATGPVVALMSGGGSSLAEVPVADLTIDDISEIAAQLMAAGADIVELNTVRAALSRLKCGGLAAAVGSGPLVTLVISDVAPAGAEFVASGPTLARPGSVGAGAVLEKYGMAPSPGSPLAAALAGATERAPIAHDLEVIADGATAAAAAASAVRRAGCRPIVEAKPLAGEARDCAVAVVSAGTPPGSVTVYWGETTVTVTGPGRGGRNHEAALAAALALDGRDGVFLAAGTDGVDGNCDAAGAVVDGATMTVARAAGVDGVRLLAANDSCGFFDVAPGRIVTGPTGTNVADLWMFANPA